MCGFNSPQCNFRECKSEGHIDFLNSTQTVHLNQLSINGPKSRNNTNVITKKGKLKPKLMLPSIHEKHNTYHSNKSPVVLQRKSRFKQVQVEGGSSKSLFYSLTKGQYSTVQYSAFLPHTHIHLIWILTWLTVLLCLVVVIFSKERQQFLSLSESNLMYKIYALRDWGFTDEGSYTISCHL